MEKLLNRAKEIQIIFFDIDDTLRVKDTGFMPASMPQIFAALREKGILTGIATGRNLFGVVPEIRALNPDFFVTANGAYVVDKLDQIIYQHALPTTVVSELVAWLEASSSEYAFYGADEVVASAWSDTMRAAIAPIYGQLPVNPDYYLTHDIYQMESLSEQDDQLVLPEKLADKVRMVRWHPHSSDIVPMTGSKAEGVRQVLDKLGLSAANVMNFGDELNDVELFDLGGLSVAMKVSHPKILEMADYITDTVENDGIEKALKALNIL
ncbi:hydrolase [Bacilli bacterium]|nr:hydrolase [Bacilli bacterium]GHU41664.1 hydrolase [Bacilli bacterium]